MFLQSSTREEWVDLFNKYVNPETIDNAIIANHDYNVVIDVLWMTILILVCIRLVISCISAVIKWFKK